MRLGSVSLPMLPLLAALFVAASIPLVFTAHLHPTVLFAVLAYLGWGVVAALSSAHFADRHLGLVLSAAFILSLVVFFVPGTRSLCIWAFIYLALLYLSFPVTASASAAV